VELVIQHMIEQGRRDGGGLLFVRSLLSAA
jgi:hypothetical protein